MNRYAQQVRHSFCLLLMVLLVACVPQYSKFASGPVKPSPKVLLALERLAKTINYADSLEAESDGPWTVPLKQSYFDEIKSAGFTAVRLPVFFERYSQDRAPYGLEESLMRQVDAAVRWALERKLAIIIDWHRFDRLNAYPFLERERFLAIWRQIAERYKNMPEDVIFEVLNEPYRIGQSWYSLQAFALEAIRESNPDRAVIVTPTDWASSEDWRGLQLPPDPNLIVTFHFYEPFEFTHQQAAWISDAWRWRNISWQGSSAERALIQLRLDLAKDYARSSNRPIFMGEFGAYDQADYASRVRWTRFVREQAEARGFSWGYWEFASGFGAFDRKQNRWRRELLDALLK